MKDLEALAQLDALAFEVQRRAENLGVDAKLWNVGVTRDYTDPYFRVSPEEMDRLLRIIAATAQ